MKKNQHASDAQKLLHEYRPAVWRKSLLEAVPGIGQKALDACMEQMRFTQELAQTLRSNRLLGEKLYWIIYASYLTDRQPIDVGEILDYIAQEHESIPRRTYFRLKVRAIQMLDDRLKEMANEKLAG